MSFLLEVHEYEQKPYLPLQYQIPVQFCPREIHSMNQSALLYHFSDIIKIQTGAVAHLARALQWHCRDYR